MDKQAYYSKSLYFDLNLLKRLVFIAEITSDLNVVNFHNQKIVLNNLLKNYRQVAYALQVLKIPFTLDEPDRINRLTEVNVSFGCEVKLPYIYRLTFVLKEICGDDLDIYIRYPSTPDKAKNEIIIGSFITKSEDWINISAPISPNEILKLDIRNMTSEDFCNIFPNVNYCSSGISGRSKKELERLRRPKTFDNNNYGSSEEKYGGYNGFSDDVIDDAFEGDPSNTWNVD